MSTRQYNIDPIEVEHIKTKHRCIKTKIPVPESIAILKSLENCNPISTMGQPPVIWHNANNFYIYDKWGNKWLDWSACVLLSNAGHARKEIGEAVKQVIDQGLFSTYVFAHEKRLELSLALQKLSPDPGKYSVFLLSTGSEAVENCIKLAKTYALGKYGPDRKYIITFTNAFHGRTLGAQLAGGIEKQKKWIIDEGRTFAQVPFPDGFVNNNTFFELFLSVLKEKNITPGQIAGIMTESYQGVGPNFLPYEYAQNLQSFCRKNDIIMIYDEVQAGFGRTGKMFCFEHYDVKPDLIACGKGISSSLPISAVLGRKDIMNLYEPGSMTSTHSGSPIPVAAAIENLKIFQRENIVDNANKIGKILISELKRIQEKYPATIGWVQGRGLVAGMHIVKNKSKELDPDTAFKINEKCFQKGLLMFAPVGISGECIKINPPLIITEDALREGIGVLEDVCDEVFRKDQT